MRRERVYRGWTTCVAIAAWTSGIALWWQGERGTGAFGLATALLHVWWASDARAWIRRRATRRPIVIATLRHRDAAVTHDTVTHG